MPADASQRVPIRSASRPLTGATTATTSGNGVSSSPVRAGESPRSCSK
jgi:hypothetical protein